LADKALNPKQSRFVAEYLIDLNATQAAIRAGYSERTAYSIGPENLKKPEIAAAIAEGQAKRAGIVEITAEKVLRDLESARHNAMATMEWGPAIRACELQGKHIGMFSDKIAHVGGGPDDPPIVTRIELVDLK
jgi:phage terminase small subunit